MRIKELEIQWLAALNPPSRQIANFGCGSGDETLALLAALDAAEVVGIDKDVQTIRQARGKLETIKQAAWNALCALAWSVDDRWQRENEVPTCVKGLIFDQIPDALTGGIQATRLGFVEADMATPITELHPDYFDLAYCKKVLYHVWCEQGEPAAQSAVNEMARVVRPGGWVVAVEPLSSSPTDGVALDFRQFFERAGLIQFTEIGAEMDWPAHLCPYLYERPQHIANVEGQGLEFYSGE